MKNRYGFCFVAAFVMLMWSLPRLTFEGMREEVLFSGAWMLLAFCVLAGNLSGILYGTDRKREVSKAGSAAKVRQKGR